MRILFLNPVAQLGGAETSLLDLIAQVRLARPAWHLTLVVAQHGPLVEKVTGLGVEVRVEPLPAAVDGFGDSGIGGQLRSVSGMLTLGADLMRLGVGSISYVQRLTRLIHEIQPDAIHAQGFKMHVLSALARRGHAPLIWHFHDYVSPRALMSRLTRWLAPRATLGLANSHSVAADLQSVCGGRLGIETVYNLLNLSAFQPDGERLDLDAAAQMEPAPQGTVRIGLAATFARWKGHRIFMEALSRLSQDNIRAYIIGGPIYQTAGSQYSLEELRTEAARLGLGGRLGFTGFLGDVPAALRSLDIVVHCSTSPEPFGMVIVEGMASGRAVVAADSSGAAEVFKNGVSAMSHKSGSADALAACLERLITDPALRIRMGKAARLRVQSVFGGSAPAERIISVYERVHRNNPAAEWSGAAVAGRG